MEKEPFDADKYIKDALEKGNRQQKQQKTKRFHIDIEKLLDTFNRFKIPIILITIILLVVFYVFANRYTIVTTSGNAYKLNRLSGQVWYIVKASEVRTKPYKR